MQAATPSCPRCRVALFRGPSQHLELFGCGRCGGIWLDRASVLAVFERLDPEAHSLATMVDRAASVTVNGDSLAGPCPVCAAPMKPRSIAMGGIVVDDCSMHGTWYDREELRKWIDALSAARNGKRLAVAAGVGVAAVGVGAAYAYSQREEHEEQHSYVDGDDAVDGVLLGAEVLADSVEVAPALLEGAGEVADAGVEVAGAGLEVAGDVLGGVFELLGSLFD